MVSRERILVGLSGGVDSSVAALLLKRQGHDVAGAYMKNWINEDNVIGHCPWQEDIEDARRVAEQIGIDFQVVNLMGDYRDKVVGYLLDGYQRGLTPNPDIMCNREIKFGVFRAWARDHGFDAVATGHYARRVAVSELPLSGSRPPAGAAGELTRDVRTATVSPLLEAPSDHPSPSAARGFSSSGVTDVVRPQCPTFAQPDAFALLEGTDKNKDQSYFLALLAQDQLVDARFPIGHLTKPELRELATEAGLATAAKKDSQGICFIGEVKMQDFLRQYVPDRPGPILRATDGRVLGEHRGLHYYTIGQRRGIGIPSNTDFQKYVVVGKRAADNALLVAFDAPEAPGLFVREARVHSLRWNAPEVSAACSLEGRVRYRDPRVKLDFLPEGNGCARVRFHEPQRAVASGQILALHDGERLLGGGVFA